MVSLKIDKVAKSFGKKQVLKEINLEAKGSEIIGLIGKSGCGKSTLLKILVGYLKPEKGSIHLDEKDILSDMRDMRKLVGYTTQENSFYEKLTVIENMRYYARLYSVPIKDREKRISNLLDKVGLLSSKDTLGERISGGMKRRLDFAISLVHDPSILILDEPTTGLDPLLIDQFWNIVKDISSKEDKIVIMTSHILPEIEEYCTKVAVIDEGKVIKVLSKHDMKGLEQKFRKMMGHDSHDNKKEKN